MKTKHCRMFTALLLAVTDEGNLTGWGQVSFCEFSCSETFTYHSNAGDVGTLEPVFRVTTESFQRSETHGGGADAHSSVWPEPDYRATLWISGEPLELQANTFGRATAPIPSDALSVARNWLTTEVLNTSTAEVTYEFTFAFSLYWDSTYLPPSPPGGSLCLFAAQVSGGGFLLDTLGELHTVWRITDPISPEVTIGVPGHYSATFRMEAAVPPGWSLLSLSGIQASCAAAVPEPVGAALGFAAVAMAFVTARRQRTTTASEFC